MDEPKTAPAEATDGIVAQLAQARVDRPNDAHAYLPLPRGRDPGWTTLGGGIVAAAGAYPAVVTVILTAIGGTFAIINADSPSSRDLLQAVVFANVTVIIGGAVAASLAAIACVPVLFLVWGAFRLLNVRAAWSSTGVFSGGAVVIALWFPGCYGLCQGLLAAIGSGGGISRIGEPLMLVLVGPVLAIFVGQVGGAYGGLVLERAGIGSSISDPVVGGPRMSFSLRQLLGLTLVVSLALAALRLAGLLDAAMFLIVTCWLGLQITLRRPAVWLAERILRSLRRPRRRGYLPHPAGRHNGGGAA